VDRLAFLAGAAAGLLAPRALLGGTPVALVTADLESRVVAYELPGLRRLRAIPTVELPRAIEQVGNVAVVAHSEVGVLTLIDGADLVVRKVLRGFDEPRYAAAAHDGRHAFVTDSGSGQVVVVDVLAGRTVARVDVGGPARHVSLNRAGRRLWVALGMKARHVAVVDVADPRRPRLVRRFEPPWLAHDVGFAARDRVWVTSGSARELAIYHAGSGELLRRLPARAPPRSTSPSSRARPSSRAATTGRSSAATRGRAPSSGAGGSRSAPTTSRRPAGSSSRRRWPRGHCRSRTAAGA